MPPPVTRFKPNFVYKRRNVTGDPASRSLATPTLTTLYPAPEPPPAPPALDPGPEPRDRDGYGADNELLLNNNCTFL